MPELVTDYQLGIKQEIIGALRKVFSTTYPDADFVNAPGNKNRVYIGTEFPLKETQYPSIFITYSEGLLQNAGIGNFDLEVQDDGTTQKIIHWRFEGATNFNIFAKTTTDREMLAAGLINILAFGRDTPEFKPFWDELYDADFVALALYGDSPRALGDSVEQAPWGAAENIYTRSYQVTTVGDFWTRPLAGGLVRISDIDMFPYRHDQPVPQGNQTPPNNTSPWIG